MARGKEGSDVQLYEDRIATTVPIVATAWVTLIELGHIDRVLPILRHEAVYGEGQNRLQAIQTPRQNANRSQAGAAGAAHRPAGP